MVKLQDGSIVAAGDLFNGSGQDEEGKQLKFEQVKTATIPTFEARSDTTDGSNQTRIYSFGLADTNVRVSVTTATITTTKAKEEQEEPTEGAAATTEPEPQSKQPSVMKTEKAYKSTSAIPDKKKYY